MTSQTKILQSHRSVKLGWVGIIRLFTLIIIYILLFVTVSHFDPSLLFTGKAGVYLSGALMGIHSKVRLLALAANVRLG
jgi:hypothetical protein